MCIKDIWKKPPRYFTQKQSEKGQCVVPEYSDVPADLIMNNSRVTLTSEIMFVNQVPFLVTSACQIGLATTKCLPARTAKAIANNLNQVIHLHHRGGFTIQIILMDN